MTIQEIAKLANVSIGTVDRVIHNRGRVSQQTIDRVNKVINESRFEPNQYARNLRLNKLYKFGVLIRDYEPGDNTYWEILHDGCVAAAKELKSLSAELVFNTFGNNSGKSLYGAGKELIAENIDGLILAPNSESDAMKLIKELGNLPYAFVNTGLESASPIIDTSQDSYIAGQTAAKVMSMLRPSGKVFITIKRETYSTNTVKRIDSFCKYFDGNDNISIFNFVIDHNCDIVSQFKVLIESCPTFDGVFVANSDIALYENVLSSLCPGLRPAIIGYDAVPKNIALLEDGKIDCLISQQPFSQGYNAVQQLYFYSVLDNKQTTVTRAPVTVIFKENLESYKSSIRERYY